MVMYGVLLTQAPSFDHYHIPYKEKQVLCMETESEKISEPEESGIWPWANYVCKKPQTLGIFAVTQ